ncbi:MAG: beta-glucosidase BglX [Clostridia bacterium]|nr:beta-glucosidase BglX [Clostridia bacterium]
MRPEELKQLLADMSLEEKIGQLVQLPSYFQNGGHITGPASDMGITQEDLQLAGSYLSIIGAEKIKALQDEYMAHHPHHIPLVFMADIINGYRTVFPVPLAQGCTFRPDMVEAGAATAAKEAAAAGIHVTFSPMADLVRDARWGRVMESTGEDPYLNGLMAAAMVKGYQGESLTDKGRMAACLKHFAGYGAPEAGRDYNNVELSPRTLKEDYLPAYQAAIDAGTALVMTSFNTLDRIPSTANRWLMRDVLRKDMGFDGVLISDWAAVGELVPHGVAEDFADAARLAIEAGVDMDMVSPSYTKNLKTLVEKGKVPESLIDESCLRVLELKNKLGLFENPYKDLSADDEAALLLCEEHKKAAQACAELSFVLLKNEGMLPLEKNAAKKTAFIGPFVDNKFLCGSWAIFCDDQDTTPLKAALMDAALPGTTVFAKGCPVLGPEDIVHGFQKPVEKEEMDLEQALQEAIEAAKAADQVVLALGEHREFSGEAASRATLTLPACQQRLMDEVAKVNENITVILFCGRPMDVRAIQDKAKALLVAWFPGTEGGPALVRTLYGDSTPSGKLSMSFPYCAAQLPIHYNHLSTGRPFSGNFAEARFGSKYQDIPNQPLYPFGFGLTYTEFSLSSVRLDRDTLQPGETLTASVTLQNTGSRPGTETVQLYIRDVKGSVARPVRELKGFRQVTLQPGETETVSFAITEDMLRFYDIHMDYVSEPGRFEVFIGTDSRTENKASFTLKK